MTQHPVYLKVYQLHQRFNYTKVFQKNFLNIYFSYNLQLTDHLKKNLYKTFTFENLAHIFYLMHTD